MTLCLCPNSVTPFHPFIMQAQCCLVSPPRAEPLWRPPPCQPCLIIALPWCTDARNRGIVASIDHSPKVYRFSCSFRQVLPWLGIWSWFWRLGNLNLWTRQRLIDLSGEDQHWPNCSEDLFIHGPWGMKLSVTIKKKKMDKSSFSWELACKIHKVL